MSDDNKIKTALAKMKAEDVSVDAFGRVVLQNPELMEGLAGVPGTLAANYGCCTNGALCKEKLLAEVMADFDVAKKA